MRLVQYTPTSGSTRIGVVDGDDVIDLQQAGERAGVTIPERTTALLAEPEWRATVDRAVAAADASDVVGDRSTVSLEAPVTDPQKVVCVGLNYQEHADESGGEAPDEPILFAKFPTAITGPGAAIEWDPGLTSEVDYEAELAVVMGATTRRVDRETAAENVAGYTVANDVSARDLQFADKQWVRGKSLDTFCPLGPELVTADELGDPHDLAIWTDLEGERLQESTTGDMIFDVDELVSFCSQAFTLLPGDVILTGTPPGVGAFREPPVYLDDGDEVTVGIEGIGALTNPCVHW